MTCQHARSESRNAKSRMASMSLDDQAVGHLELSMVDQPADAVQYRGFGFEGRVVAEQRARFSIEAYWLRDRCCQLESANSAVVPDLNSAQLTERMLAVFPNQPAAIARKPRAVSADGATTLNDSPRPCRGARLRAGTPAPRRRRGRGAKARCPGPERRSPGRRRGSTRRRGQDSPAARSAPSQAR